MDRNSRVMDHQGGSCSPFVEDEYHEQEQEQALLLSWRSRNAGSDDEEKRRQPCRTRPWRAPSCMCIASLIATLSIATAAYAFFTGKHGLPQQKSAAAPDVSAPVQTNDYILNPDWNYSDSPRRREYSWTIRDTIHNPDGIYRPMMLVNNQFPGPLIEANEGDTIVVHVDNQADNATSIHWHGIYQIGTPHMDGTVGITQCPIAPGTNFTYEFTVSGQSGSYWWHSHQGVQSSDGLHGPLIIHARDEREKQKISYDTDRVVMLSDHYHDLSSALLWQYLKPDQENAEPVPVGGLLNGRSTRDCSMFPDRKCDNTSSHVGIPRIDLARSQSHRLRLINVGAFAEFQVQIDEHQLAVTEVDGTDVQPETFHRVNISPAQRYSVIVNARDTSSDTFWFRARMVTTCFTDPPPALDADLLAVVRYNPEIDVAPTSADWQEQLAQDCKDLDTTKLVPVDVVQAPAEADAFFYLRSNFEIGKYRLSRGFFNQSTFRPDIRSPSLLRTIDGLASANETFSGSARQQAAFVNDAAFDTSRELVIQTTGIQTIDILVSNFDDGSHPLHLHGYKYFALAQGHGYPPLTAVGVAITRENLAPLYDRLDLSNPLRRDTASIEAFGWTLIRVVADNPGAWALHCHISWHSEAGLVMQLLTSTDELEKMQVPEANLRLCVQDGVERGMGPDDEDFRDLA